MNVQAKLLIVIVIVAQFIAGCASNIAAATSMPSVVVTPTTDPLQSAKIVQAFWDALEAGDLETAMVYVAEDVTCAGFCYFTGRETFRSLLQGYMEAGFITKISDVKTVGSIVTYSWQVYRNGNFLRAGDSDEVMHVEDGKIIYWENQHR